MNMDGGNKPGQRDQHDAAHRHGGVCPASGLYVGLRLHAGSLNQYDATCTCFRCAELRKASEAPGRR